LGPTNEPHLVAKQIARVGFGLYGARNMRKTIKLEKARFVTFDESVGRQPHDEWFRSHRFDGRVIFRANRQQTLIEAVRLGLGFGILPCMAADTDASLVRILGPSQVFSRELYVVMHADVRQRRRVRAVVDAIEAYVAAERDRIAGKD
jgi:DNA-binding transcriptional LysR family regulator